MAKQIRDLHAQLAGDSTEWLKVNIVYVVEDSVDSTMSKSGQVELEYEGTDTLEDLHAAAVIAVNEAEGIS